jgi:hypothetical protein
LAKSPVPLPEVAERATHYNVAEIGTSAVTVGNDVFRLNPHTLERRVLEVIPARIPGYSGFIGSTSLSPSIFGGESDPLPDGVVDNWDSAIPAVVAISLDQ